MKNVLLFIVVSFSCYLFSCKPDDEIIDDKKPAETEAKHLLVLNEGNFGWGNASLSRIDLESKEVNNHQFFEANGQNLGDVAQSVTQFGELLYVVVNGSGKILVLDKNTLKIKKTITDLVSPRYIAFDSSGKGLVTDLYANSIKVIDGNSMTVLRSIPLKGWSEKLVYHRGNFWVSCPDKAYIYQVNKELTAILDSVFIGNGTADITYFDDNLWVLRNNKTEGLNPALLRISNSKIIDSLSLEANTGMKMSFNSHKKILYFIGSNSIDAFDPETFTRTNLFAIPDEANYYNIYSNKDYLWLSDARNFTLEGEILEFNLLTNEKTHDYKVDIIPNEMWYVE